jgi:hypothetical protein
MVVALIVAVAAQLTRWVAKCCKTLSRWFMALAFGAEANLHGPPALA